MFHENKFPKLNPKSPEYYTRWSDVDTFTLIDPETKQETKVTGAEHKQQFMDWFQKIKPFLDAQDKNGALNLLQDWKEESRAKFELFNLVNAYFVTEV